MKMRILCWKGEGAMKRCKTIGTALAVLVLAATVSVLPSSAQQKAGPNQDQPSAQAQNHMMSMPGMMQTMHQIMNETSQMKNSMQGNSQGMGNMQGNSQNMSRMHGMMMGGNDMMPLCNGMHGMAQSLNGMMSELNGMMSNKHMMRNPEYKEHMQKMQKYMSSMMRNLTTMVDSAKSAEAQSGK
jgi:hypothetical protein